MVWVRFCKELSRNRGQSTEHFFLLMVKPGAAVYPDMLRTKEKKSEHGW